MAGIVGLALLSVLAVSGGAQATERPTLQYFGAEGCPHCERMEAFLDELAEEHGPELVIERHDVADPRDRQRWVDETQARGREPTGVPTAVLGDRIWVGFDHRVAASIRAAVTSALDLAEEEPPEAPGLPAPEETLRLPLIGEVTLAERSPVGVTAAIAFVDGFNPCSLWVLTVLLAMVLNAGVTRRRLALVGGTFLAVTGLIYGLFIVGAFTIVGLVQHLGAIRFVVAALALFIGVLNVRDALNSERSATLSIPDRFKPRIFRSGRQVRDPARSTPAVLGLTVAMAAGVSLVELPCTAGFPVLWSGILRIQEVETAQFMTLLALYLLIYVGIELIIFAGALVTLRPTRLTDAGGRLLRMVGGTVMLALGVVLLTAPELMQSVVGAVATLAVAVLVALAITLVSKRRTG